MTAFSLLLILVGVFVILNADNFRKVLQGQADISFLQPNSPASGQGAGATGSTSPGTTGNVNTSGTLPDDTLGGTSSGQH